MTVVNNSSSSAGDNVFPRSGQRAPVAPADPTVPPGFADGAACGEGIDADTLIHCGRPMAVRRLDTTDPCCPANRAVLEAALDGHRVHACSCGHLQRRPFRAGSGELLCSPQECGVFEALFLHRVLAAAGTLETAEWSLDQTRAEAPPTGNMVDEWIYEANAESARWALDAAQFALDAELLLAATHGVSPTSLAGVAALPHEQVERLVSSSTRPGTRDDAEGPVRSSGGEQAGRQVATRGGGHEPCRTPAASPAGGSVPAATR